MRMISKILLTALFLVGGAIFIIVKASERQSSDTEITGEELTFSEKAGKRFDALVALVRKLGWEEAIKALNGYQTEDGGNETQADVSIIMNGDEKYSGLRCVQGNKTVVSLDPKEIDQDVSGDPLTKKRYDEVNNLASSGRATLSYKKEISDPSNPGASKKKLAEKLDDIIGHEALLGKNANDIKEKVFCYITTTKS